jgi:hypothetical protein
VSKFEIGSLVYPEPFDPVAKQLIESLLVPEPSGRLGCTSYQKLKDHIFFKGTFPNRAGIWIFCDVLLMIVQESIGLISINKLPLP